MFSTSLSIAPFLLCAHQIVFLGTRSNACSISTNTIYNFLRAISYFSNSDRIIKISCTVFASSMNHICISSNFTMFFSRLSNIFSIAFISCFKSLTLRSFLLILHLLSFTNYYQLYIGINYEIRYTVCFSFF